MVLCLSLLLTVPLFASASELYTLRDVDSVPAGVTPLVVSAEDLDSLLEELSRPLTSVTTTAIVDQTNFLNNEYTMNFSAESCHSIGGWCYIVQGRARATFGDPSNPPRFLSCTAVNDGLTGYTVGFTMQSSGIGCDMNFNNTSVELWGQGIVDWYLVVEGVLKLYSTPVSASTTRTVSH